MYSVKRKTARFNTEKKEDLARYDEILNNPLCAILSKEKEKIRDEQRDDEGNVIFVHEKFVWVVTWEERVLL